MPLLHQSVLRRYSDDVIESLFLFFVKVITVPADPAPRGAYRGRAPQMTACAPPNKSCAPPSEDCAPKKLTGSGPLECKSRPNMVFFCELTPDFMTFLG